MNKKIIAALVIIALLVVIFVVMLFSQKSHNTLPVSKSQVIEVVAAENFWGSLAAQLGGNRVHVVSIVSDPNADPHEYESNTQDAKEFATANYVILNGAGYDSWANKLLGAAANPNQKVLTVATLLGKKEGDNPHFWYSPDYVNEVVLQMENDFISLDPSNKTYYQNQYQALMTGLEPYQNRIQTIKQQFGGTKVAATEDIFQYLANASGLDLISPPAFIQAVAEGNDPPASSIVTFENQLKSKSVAVLVYNQQTVTPLTENIKKLAADEGIPVIGITETIQPPDLSMQDWMNAQLVALENALNAKTLGN